MPPIGLETGRKLIGHGIANLVRSALKLRGAADDNEQVAADLARFMEIYGARLTISPHPIRVSGRRWRCCMQQGWHMGVCTNKREAFARAIVEGPWAGALLQIVSGPDTFGVSKPDPRQLTETASAAGESQPVFFVGDSEVDVAAAKAAGYARDRDELWLFQGAAGKPLTRCTSG